MRKKMNHMKRVIATGCAAVACLGLTGGAEAVTFAGAPGLTISGTAEYRASAILALVSTNASQTGDFFVSTGGVSNTSTFDGATVVGSNPVMGDLTQVGDGLGGSADIVFGPLDDVGGRIDLTVDIMNTSMNEYKITFKANNAVNAADAGAASGNTDGFGRSDFFVTNPSGADFSSTVQSSFAIGDQLNGVMLGTNGALVSDSGMTSFDVIIAPMGGLSFAGFWVGEGAFIAGLNDAVIDFSGELTVEAVMNLTQPPPGVIPEPVTAALGLMGLGVIGLAARRRAVV